MSTAELNKHKQGIWKILDNAEKSPWQKMQDGDEERYEKALSDPDSSSLLGRERP
jgi:hypothetical protein